MNIIFVFNSVLLGAGLAMDAFSVSLANGLNEPHMKKGKMFFIAAVFGIFQMLMPMAGWICVHTVLEHFISFRKFIPWIALILLGYIGTEMLVGSMHKKDEKSECGSPLTPAALFIQGIATSIDALSVGFTIAEYKFIPAFTASFIIGAVTAAISTAGIILGRKFGTRLSSKAEIAGGTILILIGIEIFLKGILE